MFKRTQTEKHKSGILRGRRKEDGVVIIASFIFAVIVCFALSRWDLFKNDENNRYMLSALVQSEAAVIAIVVSINLVATQLGTAYSWRIARVFSESLQFKGLIFLYVFAILYSLCALGMVEEVPGYEVHVRISYSIGVFCFVFLLLYTVEILKIIDPSKNIEKLSQKISKERVLRGDDVIQPITDIVTRSILKSDFETVKSGLEAVRDKVIDILRNEEFTEREASDFWQNLMEHFLDTGRYSKDQKT